MVQLSELMDSSLSVLIFLADNPQKYTYTQLREKTELAKATLSKFLSKLQKNNLITLTKIGRNKLYQINIDNYLVRRLKILNSLAKLSFLTSLSRKHNCEFYLFGSAARGGDNTESDYDLLVLGKINKEEIIADIDKLAKKLKKEIRLQLFTASEWALMGSKDPAFYERVEKDKILIK
ncbi:MAG: nucleotidyltransferase domain-containing protein [Nanoarchaeota archaeon]